MENTTASFESNLLSSYQKHSQNSATLKSATYQALKEAILFAVPDEEVTENQIAAVLGISRTPVREAMHQLASDGLLEIHHGKKAKISGMTSKDMEDIAVILKSLHTLATELCIANAAEEDLRKLEETVALVDFYTERKDLSRISYYNTQFHIQIASFGKNKWLSDIVEKLLSYTMIYREYAVSRPGRMEKARQEHNNILNAILERDQEKARALVNEHVATAFVVS